MRIAIASDHGGFQLKARVVEQLRTLGHDVKDLGTNDANTCDYPDYAHLVARGLGAGEWERGILVCGTGVGMAMSANRHEGVRAVNCSDVYTAKLSRSHNDANVLCIGERVVGEGLAMEIVSAWITEPASTDERHTRRRTKIETTSAG